MIKLTEVDALIPRAQVMKRMLILPPPKRVNGCSRRYNPSVLKRLGLIQLLRQSGFGVRESQALFGSLNTDAHASPGRQTPTTEKIAGMDVLIKQTQATKAWLVGRLWKLNV